MKFDCYCVDPHAPAIVPARSERPWMEATSEHYTYRCTPLTMANATGWDLLCPTDFSATWTGGAVASSLTITPGDGAGPGPFFAQSHSGTES